MSAVGGFPSLSQLLAWPTEHLTEAADHWEAVGGRSYGVAHQVWRDSLSVDWQGQAADALRASTHADMLTTSAVADQLHEAARVARNGASDLHAARSRMRYAVKDARASGFDVGEDLSVIDRSTAGSLAQRAARQAEAQAIADEIVMRAAQLHALDREVADKVTAAVAGIRNAFPEIPGSTMPEAATKPTIHAVDHHWKQNPPPKLDPADMSEEEARAAYEALKRDIARYGNRCLRRPFVLPQEQAAFDACVADAGSLNERKAALEARLRSFGVEPESTPPSAHAPPEATETPPFPPPRQITGLTEHAAEQVESRDGGHGVNAGALQDAVVNPVGPPKFKMDELGRGAYVYVGKDATVVLNKDGRVVTAWANSRDGWRNP